MVSPVVLASLTVGLAFVGGALTTALAPYVDLLPAGGHDEHLALWHGFELPLLLSAVTLVGGLTLFRFRDGLCRFQSRFAQPVTAERAYRWGIRAVDRVAIEVTGTFQRGSVSVYLAVILAVVLAGPGAVLVVALVDGGAGRLDVVLWDRAGQPVVALVMVAAAIFTVRSRRRLRAVVLVGVTGYGCALLFLLHGAPDLALTQVLVETVSLVVFVLVLRRLPDYFTDKPLRLTRYARMALATGVGLAVGGFVLVAGNARTADADLGDLRRDGLPRGLRPQRGQRDPRRHPGLGHLRRDLGAGRGRDRGGQPDLPRHPLLGDPSRLRRPLPSGVEKQPTGPGRRVWLPGPRTLSPDRRSIVFEVVTRLVFHTIMVFSLYLLVAGHNLPGGGFAAGMVAGLALMVRYLAGGRYELDEAAPIDAGVLIGTGLFVAALSGLGPMAFGGSVLQTADAYVDLPLLGEVHLVSSVGFDIGVYLVVVGLVLDLLRTFGSRLDRQILRAERESAEQDPIGAAVPSREGVH